MEQELEEKSSKWREERAEGEAALSGRWRGGPLLAKRSFSSADFVHAGSHFLGVLF